MISADFGIRWLTLASLLVLLKQPGVLGQFEDLQGCVSNCRFVPLITGCMAEKFLIMLNLPPLSTECPSPSTASYDAQAQQHRAAEIPTAHAGVKLANPTLRSGYLDDLGLRHAQRKQQSKLSDQTFKFIDNFLSKTSLFQSDTPVLDSFLKTKSVPSLESIMLDTIEPLKEEAYRFKQTLLEAQLAMLSMSKELKDGEASQWRQARSTLDELERILTCFRTYDEAAYEDGLSWTKCLFICRDLPLLSTCMADAFTQIPECSRTMWLKDLILRVFTDFLDLENCYFDIQSPTVEAQPITLEEGGAPSNVQFITYQPPGVYCWPANPLSDVSGVARGVISNVFKLNPPCTVEVQLTTSNYMYDTLPYVRSDLIPGLDMGRPKCRNGSAVNQVAIGWHGAAINNSGIISLTEQNWNQTFSIPLTAVVDYKKEDDQYLNVSFTMKFVVDGNTINTTKLPMEIHDRDPVDISTCTSFNDPHITTFDGLYYNNFFHGYFQMYKHQELPYEVQVAYQACDVKTYESCTCAVAVRSGDDVFVVDRCRHLPDACTGSPADCSSVQKVALYLNGELTPGTDIYKLDGGLSYMVSLPHGTLVKIVTNREMLNVYITPSPYDLSNTRGLCGIFNEDRGDDLTLSDGTRTNLTESLQPALFIESWRLVSNETIFEGSVKSDMQYNFGNYCQCSHYFIDNAVCTCSYSELRETCDLELENKVSAENLTSIVRRSKKSSEVEPEDTRDMDISYLPNDNITFDDNINWSEEDSFQYCLTQTRLSGKQLIKDCKGPELINPDFLAPVNNAFQGCMDDMAILDATNEAWSLSYLETMKYGCLQKVYRSSGIGARSWAEYVNETCINDCSKSGICVLGKCQCSTGYTGSDCSILKSQPPVIIMDQTNLCDTRYQNCSYSTVYGRNFTDDITCRVTPQQTYTNEKKPSNKVDEVGIILISSDQIACVLPRSGSFQIEILWQGKSLAMASPNSAAVRATVPLNFKAYDSACYVCSPNQQYCDQKNDGTYCIISNGCYSNLQPKAENDCQICNVSHSETSFYYKTDEVCTQRRLQEEKQKADDKRDQDIRIGVSVGLSGLVVIITIIMLIISRRSDSRSSSLSFSSNSSTHTSKSSHHSSSSGVEVSSESNSTPTDLQRVEQRSSTAPVIVVSDESGTHMDSQISSGNENGNSDSHPPKPYDHANSDTVIIPTTSAILKTSPPGYESHGIGLESKYEGSGKPLYPRVLLIGGENVQNGSIKSLSKVPMVRERTTSISSTKSVGIGGGPPIQYYLNRHSSNASSAANTNVRL